MNVLIAASVILSGYLADLLSKILASTLLLFWALWGKSPDTGQRLPWRRANVAGPNSCVEYGGEAWSSTAEPCDWVTVFVRDTVMQVALVHWRVLSGRGLLARYLIIFKGRWTRHGWRVHCRVFSLLWRVHRVTTSPCDDFTVTSYRPTTRA